MSDLSMNDNTPADGVVHILAAKLDPSLVHRVRADVSQDAIGDYRLTLDKLPPIRVALVDGKHVVIGGLHRLHAYDAEDRAEVPCRVETMTWAEAVEAAVADNSSHGVRMTREDKRAAVRLLLEESPDTSDHRIASLVGCSPTTVGTVRKESEPSKLDSSEAPPPGPRLGSDGKVRRMPVRKAISAAKEADEPAKVDMGAAAPLADYLRDALRRDRDGGTRRADALAAALDALTADELRKLERKAKEAVRAKRLALVAADRVATVAADAALPKAA